ncbi:hypothetical protein Dimus_025089 [Dionaea muscipula]
MIMSSMVPVVPKNTSGAKDFFFIPTGIAIKAPATEKTQVPSALQEHSSSCFTSPPPAAIVLAFSLAYLLLPFFFLWKRVCDHMDLCRLVREPVSTRRFSAD